MSLTARDLKKEGLSLIHRKGLNIIYESNTGEVLLTFSDSLAYSEKEQTLRDFLNKYTLNS